MGHSSSTGSSGSGKQALEIKALEMKVDRLEKECSELKEALERVDYLPVPPRQLRARVGGWEDVDHFLGVGRKISWDVSRLLGACGKDFLSFCSVLDFGCGCGRVVRFLRRAEQQMISGVDIDPEAIDWCKNHLGHVAEFEVIQPFPPLPFADGTFDFVYCISVFTHLPEDMQFQWLAEIRRVVKPQGIFITSVHGRDLLAELDRQAVPEFDRNGFVYMKGLGTAGMPDYYQGSYHAQFYILEEWTRYFKILHMQSRAFNNHQDGIVCQKI